MAKIWLTRRDRSELEKLVTVYDNARSELRDFCDQLLVDMRDVWGGRSERWQESEPGGEARDRLDEFEEWISEIPEDSPTPNHCPLSEESKQWQRNV